MQVMNYSKIGLLIDGEGGRSCLDSNGLLANCFVEGAGSCRLMGLFAEGGSAGSGSGKVVLVKSFRNFGFGGCLRGSLVGSCCIVVGL